MTQPPIAETDSKVAALCRRDRDSAFRNLINAAWRFLDHTKNQRELQDMQEYRDLAHATNEAAQVNAK
jgi:hypothetical protein